MTPSTPGHLVQMVVGNNLTKLDDVTLMAIVENPEDERLPQAVVGFRRGRYTTYMMYVLTKAVAFYKATNQTLLVAKFDITQAFDATSLSRAIEAARDCPGERVAETLNRDNGGGSYDCAFQEQPPNPA